MKGKLFVDVHVLQTVPPSCMNRDDVGTPKTAVYGGVQRARVSSQSWKHAMRVMFKELLDPSELSLRTRFVLELVAGDMVKQEPELSLEEAKSKAIKYLQMVEILPTPETKEDKAKKNSKGKKADPEATEQEVAEQEVKTNVSETAAAVEQKALFFLSVGQIYSLASAILTAEQQKKTTEDTITSNNLKEDEATKLRKADEVEAKKQVKAALQSNNGIEIELFGRMVASDKDLTVDACAQVAHAISTHAVENEQDFLAAVDDMADTLSDHGGSGFIGDTEFNSSTLYRYATVAVHDLDAKLGNVDATARAVKDFVTAFISSLPTGKINSYANNNVPNAVYVTFRTDRPANFCGAFEKAIVGGASGYVQPSAEALEAYVLDLYADFLASPDTSFVVGRYLPKLVEFGQRVPLTTLLTEIESHIKQVAQ